MASYDILEIAGLHTANNELSAVPKGAQLVAKNCVIRGKNTIESRRGFPDSVEAIPSGSVSALASYDSQILAVGNSKLYKTSTTVAWTELGSVTPVSSYRATKFAKANGKLYFTTSNGVYRIEDSSDTPELAAQVKPHAISLVATTTGNGTFADGEKAAYRATICTKDSRGRILESPPTGRAFIKNSAGASRDAILYMDLPDSITTSNATNYFYRIYRTAILDADSVTAGADPGDEMFLIQEAYLTTTDATNTYVKVYDRTPDTFLGMPLYTNPNTGDGILQTNEPPPLCEDLAWWNNRMWYANTQQPHRLFLDIVGVGADTVSANGTTGLRDSDTLTIGSSSYYANSTATSALNYRYQVVTAYDVAEDIERTAKGLEWLVTQDEINTTYKRDPGLRCSYISGPNDNPGKLMFERTTLAGASFAATSTATTHTLTSLARAGTTTVTGTVSTAVHAGHGFAVGDTVTISVDPNSGDFGEGSFTIVTVPTASTFTYVDATATTTVTLNTGTNTVVRTSHAAGKAWNPILPSSGTSISSDNEDKQHRLYFSKIGIPEAVPLLNYIDVGSESTPILRVVPLRDKLFVFKSDGIYVISGQAPFTCDLLDDTVRLVAPDSVFSVSGRIYALTNQGLVAVADSGVAIVGGPIEDVLRYNIYRASTLDSTDTARIFATGSDSEHLYIINLHTGASTTALYVMNTATNRWTTWELGHYMYAGVRDEANDKLVFGRTNVWTEKKTLSYSDYFDNVGTTITVSSQDTTVPSITYSALSATPEVGDVVYNSGSGKYARITAINGQTLTLDSNGALFTTGTYTLYMFIENVIQWVAEDFDEPDRLKQVPEIKLHFREKNFGTATVTFSSDLSTSNSDVTFTSGVEINGQSYTPATRPTPSVDRLLVPTAKQRNNLLYVTLTIEQAGAMWSLNGISYEYEMTSGRVKR